MKGIAEAALAAVIATGCSSTSTGGEGPTAQPAQIATPAQVSTPAQTSTPAQIATPTQTSAPSQSSQTVPPQGVYNSCEIDTALTTLCEPEDSAIASDGYKWEVNYIGLDAKKTGNSSLQAWFSYDASIGLGQIISVKDAINDRTGVLPGKKLLTTPFTNSLASDCGATTNAQIISCVYSVARSVPGFNWKWYIYDEPGCPNQQIGYCRGTLAGGNYRNVQTLANYIRSIDPSHEIIGTQVGANYGDQVVINNLYSWLTTPSTPTVGFDQYPIPSRGAFGTVDDIGAIATRVAKTIAATNPSENMYFVGQAFSWLQESGRGCTSISGCPFPTTSQLQQMRDQALYYANKAGKPLSMILWYYWPDITCLNNYPGCSAAVNRASLKSAAFAAFPATPPPG